MTDEAPDDAAELDIGHLDNETIYVPAEEDDDPEASAQMHMGKADEDEGNDLRDPWFHTDEGKAWLAENEDATAACEAGEC